MTIKGEKKAEKEEKRGDTTYVERQFGSFARSVRLPFEVKDEQIDARFKDGVLTIHLPKPADMQEPCAGSRSKRNSQSNRAAAQAAVATKELPHA